MYRLGCILALTIAVISSAKTQTLEASYFCSAESSGGLFYDARMRSWRGSIFDAKDKFVLGIKTLASRMESGETVDELLVTITKSGSDYPSPCSDLIGSPHKTVTAKYGVIRCKANLTDYVIGTETNRFLMIYGFGYVDGKENNDNTPSVTGGTCTKIK